MLLAQYSSVIYWRIIGFGVVVHNHHGHQYHCEYVSVETVHNAIIECVP